MPKPDEHDRAADLLERLLTDAKFRAAFRRNPAAAAKRYGLDDLAEEFTGAGKAMYTLEIRESRSSLAGVMMAAAAEGIDAADLSQSAGAGQLDTPASIAVSRALSRANLQAVPGVTGGAPGGNGAAGLEEATSGAVSGGAPAGVEVGVPDVPGGPAPVAAGLQEAHQDFVGLDVAKLPPDQAGAQLGHATFARLGSVQPAQGQASGTTADGVDQQAGTTGGGVDAGAAVVPEGAAGNHVLVEALLKDPNITLPDAAQQDLRSGTIDSRVPALLEALSAQGHKIGLSVIKEGHSVNTSSGGVSNHSLGRGFDIATVDGKPVDPSNMAARDIAEELTRIDPSIRPTEVGSPWPIDDPAFFSNAEHQNHLHIAWDDPIPAGWTPSPEVAALPGVAAAAQADGIAPGASTPDQAADGLTPTGDGSVQAGHADFGALDQASTGPPPAGRTFSGLAAVQEQRQPGRGTSVDPGAATDVPGGHALGDFLPDGSDTYPGDGAPKAEIAAWMGRQAHKAGLPAELPVMAALVESGLSNVQHGDADSLGYFQMRTSYWNQGEYAGFAKNPDLQLKWFIDHALEVKKDRLAHGRGAELQDPQRWGQLIADVEQPAEQYRGRYQEKLGEAQTLLHDQEGAVTTPTAAGYLQPSPSPSDSVAPSGTAPPMTLTPGRAGGVLGHAVAATVPMPTNVPGLETMTIDGIRATGSPVALQAVENAFRYKGTPYFYGGSSEQTGFDCSGLTQWSYHKSGIDISRVTYTQVHDGVEVADRNRLQAGDLILFRDPSGDIHHVGMYIGDHKFIHAPHTGDVVKVSDLRESYYAQQFYMGRRIAPEGALAGAVQDPSLLRSAAAGASTTGVPDPAPAAAGVAAQAGHQDFVGLPEPKQGGAPAPVRSTVQFMQAVVQPTPVQNAAQSHVAVTPTTPATQQAAEHLARQGTGASLDPAAAAELAATGYPGDEASKEQIAAWMAAQARARGLPPELPVMAALVESELHNADHGDADSLGYFQMRTSDWNKGAYAGFPQRPDLQLKWFLDHAGTVKQDRLARGESAFVDDPSKWGDWIADVENPAAQFRGRYQERLDEARQLLGTAAPA